jgi:hypothetical protein
MVASKAWEISCGCVYTLSAQEIMRINTMSDKFDVKKEVQTVDSLISHVLLEGGDKPEAFIEHANTLFAEFARMTPQQVQEMQNAMDYHSSPWRHWHTSAGITSLERDTKGNITHIKIEQASGFSINPNLDGNIDLDLSKKTVATQAWDLNGNGAKEFLKVN